MTDTTAPSPPPPPAPVPDEIRRWNWGAFLLNWIWGVGNNTFIALLALIPGVGLIMAFVLGAKGNAWAWRNGRWDSVAHFRRVQRNWAIAGVVIWGSILSCAGFAGGVIYMMIHSNAYEMAVARVEASPEARSALGTPITAGYPFGRVAVSGDSGAADVSFSVQGPRGSGRVMARAVKANGVWTLKELKLGVDGGADVIDLLNAIQARRGREPSQRFLNAAALP